MNREQAVAEVGVEAVAKVEAENCEPTSRLQDDTDTTVEYMASVRCVSLTTGADVCLSAMYYPDESEFLDADGEPLEDLGMIDWKIDHYQIS